MNYFVIGCGRVGSELAFRLYKNGHTVVVIDRNREALNNLSPEFRGRIIEGDVLSEKMLERAGIADADGLATVTNSDALNAVVGHMAYTIYKVPIVIARNYDPTMLSVLRAFSLNVVSSTNWGAKRIQEMLLDPAFRTVFSAGNGGAIGIFEVVEVSVTALGACAVGRIAIFVFAGVSFSTLVGALLATSCNI